LKFQALWDGFAANVGLMQDGLRGHDYRLDLKAVRPDIFVERLVKMLNRPVGPAYLAPSY
jgi:hypothetical protein